jgi:hypothetical protein
MLRLTEGESGNGRPFPSPAARGPPALGTISTYCCAAEDVGGGGDGAARAARAVTVVANAIATAAVAAIPPTLCSRPRDMIG